jgi:iron-sulfur cluster assembly accessory protein
MIKLSMIRKGCNGLTYELNYVSNKDKFDEQISIEEINIVLDHKSLLTLFGTEIDFIRDEIREEFVFKNKNAKGSCGCGSSFNF